MNFPAHLMTALVTALETGNVDDALAITETLTRHNGIDISLTPQRSFEETARARHVAFGERRRA